MPDFATARNGHVYAIRSSPGYEVAFEGLSEKDKDYLRAQNNGKSYTYTSDRKTRMERINAYRSAGIHIPSSFAASVQENRFKPKHKSRLY